MKNSVYVALILFSALANAEAPRIDNVTGNSVGTPVLGQAVTNALTAYNPEFKLFESTDYIPSTQRMYKGSRNETQMAIVGDFNGDGINDVVVMGHANNETLILGVISKKNGQYEVKEIERQEFEDPKTALNPPMSDSDTESDESEGDIQREKGLSKILTRLPKGMTIAAGNKDIVLSTDTVQVEIAYTSVAAIYMYKVDKANGTGSFKEFVPPKRKRK
ncbi:MAG: hypothetical protein KF799_11785 [Bdellovibrionales bacterium]|nr:hypothetical protein [Bdellovibrionales bacterium]